MDQKTLVVEYSDKRKSFRIITAEAMVNVNIKKIISEKPVYDFIPIGFFESKDKADAYIYEFMDALRVQKDPIVEFNEIVSQCKK